MAYGRYKCRAGFLHVSNEECGHPVIGQVVPGAPSVRVTRIMPKIVSDDFYSDEATARRREENREKYKPKQQLFNRHQLATSMNRDDV